MIHLFAIPQNDQSIYFLGQIFGYIGDVYAVQNAPLLLGVMFKTLNTTALVLGSFLVVHTTIVGLLKTASEGEFLGKWSSLWVPLRTVMGIAGLFPTATGYSVIQVIIMWIIVQGIGAADTLWTAVLNYVNLAGSPYAAISIPSIAVNQNMQQLFQNLTCQAHAKDNASLMNNGSSPKMNYYYCASANADPSFCGQDSTALYSVAKGSPQVSSGSQPYTLQFAMGPQKGACGTMVYGDPDTDPSCQGTDPKSQLTCIGLKAQQKALVAIVPFLGQIAGLFETADKQYISFYENQSLQPGANPVNPLTGQPMENQRQPVKAPDWVENYCNAQHPAISCTAGSPALFSDTVTSPAVDYGNTSDDAITKLYWPYYVQAQLGGPADFIGAARDLYINSIVGAVSTWILAQPPSKLSGWQSEAQGLGWITAGAYYYKMAQANNNNLSAAMPSLTVNAPNPNFAPSSAGNGNFLSQYRNNYTAALQIVNALMSQNAKNNTSVGVSTPPQLQQVGAAFGSAASGIASSFMNTLSGTGAGQKSVNPLAGLASFGESLLIAAQVLFFVMIVIIAVTIFIVSPRVFALGTGEVDGAAEAMLGVYAVVIPLIIAFMTIMVVVGGALAIYTPLIPYVIFTFGAIGWITATIEAMVAGPFIALGIMSPGGQHELMGRAEQSIMIILNLFLRPSLMVFGMMTAMLMAGVVVTMINAGFGEVMNSINGSPGPLEIVLFLLTYAFLIISALNKCFALIYLLPSKVLTYIGGQAISYGEEEGLQAVKAGSEAAAGKASSAMAGVAPSKPQVKRKEKPKAELNEGDQAANKEGDGGAAGGGGAKPQGGGGR